MLSEEQRLYIAFTNAHNAMSELYDSLIITPAIILCVILTTILSVAMLWSADPSFLVMLCNVQVYINYAMIQTLSSFITFFVILRMFIHKPKQGDI